VGHLAPSRADLEDGFGSIFLKSVCGFADSGTSVGKGGHGRMEFVSLGLGLLFALSFLLGIGYVCGKK
jgi:hypothetical protein